MAADVGLLAAAFFGPLEVAYRLQADPLGWFMPGLAFGVGVARGDTGCLRISLGKTAPA